jgi:uncharacterized damage-inducible protein DinB
MTLHPYLLPVLGAGPRVLGYLWRQLPKDAWDVPTHSGRFTPREVMAHMADWEPIFLERMQVAVANPGSAVVAYDEVARAHERGYGEWDPAASLISWSEAREETGRWLAGLDVDQWRATSEHPEKGVMSVYDQATMLLGHDLYHLDQLRDVADRG